MSHSAQLDVCVSRIPDFSFIPFQRIAKKMLLAQIKANYSSGEDSSSEDNDGEDGKKDKEEKSAAKAKNEDSSVDEGRDPAGQELEGSWDIVEGCYDVAG